MLFASLPAALIALLCTVLNAKSTSALDLTLNDIVPRDICGGHSNYTSCGHGLPSSFCCATGEQCLALNNTGVSAAALCCPKGKDCSTIAVITCNVSFQDASKYPTMPLHISNTTVSLPTCGDGCCPLGFECTSSNQCAIKAATKQAPSSSKSTASPASTKSSAASTSYASTTPHVSAAQASATDSPLAVQPATSSESTGKKNVAGLVLAGLFPGLIVGALIVAAVLYYLRRQKAKKGWKSDTSSSYFGPPTPHPNNPIPKISGPIYQPGMTDRTVFGHNRTASGRTVPDGNTVADAYYKPTQARSTADSATLVSPSYHIGSSDKTRTLDPPFETPTRPPKLAQINTGGPIRGLFRSPGSRSLNSRRTARQSSGSVGTISMFRVPSYQRTPDVRQTTYSEVYRAAGISPSKIPGSVRPSEDTARGYRAY